MSYKLLKIIDPLRIINLPRNQHNFNSSKNNMVGHTGRFLLRILNSSRLEVSQLNRIMPGRNKHSCHYILATRLDERIISRSNSNNSKKASQELVSNKEGAIFDLIVQKLRALSKGRLHMLRPRQLK